MRALLRYGSLTQLKPFLQCLLLTAAMLASAPCPADNGLSGYYSNLRNFLRDEGRVIDTMRSQYGSITDQQLASMGKAYAQVQFADFRMAKISDQGLQYLVDLPLVYLDLRKQGISEKGFIHLSKLKSLEHLNVSGTKTNDKALALLKSLPNLRHLNLADTAVSDQGLVHLTTLKKLKVLQLPNTKISKAGLIHLRSLPSLTQLNVAGTKISLADLKSFAAKMSQLQLVYHSDPKLSGHLVENGTRFVDHWTLHEHPAGSSHLEIDGKAVKRNFNNRKTPPTKYQRVWKLNETMLSQLSGERFASLQQLSFLGPLTNLIPIWWNEGIRFHRVGNSYGVDDFFQFPDIEFENIERELELKAPMPYELRNKDLKTLGELESLEKLEIYGCPIDGTGLMHLKSLPLKWLRLSQTRITHDELKYLVGLPLEHLNLSQNTLGDASSLPLADKLETLTSGLVSQFETSGFASLRKLPLKTLILNSTTTDDAALAQLHGMQLTELDLSKTFVTDRGVAKLAGMPLKKLTLSRTRISDESFQTLATLPLEELDISNTSIDGKGLSLLKNRKLKRLNLSFTKLSLAGFQALAELTSLEELVISNKDGLVKMHHEALELRSISSREAVKNISKLINLRTLDLTAFRFNSSDLATIRGLKNLRTLRLGNLGAAQRKFVRGFKILSELSALEYLSIESCQGMSNEALSHLATLHKLKQLRFDECPGYDNKGLRYLAKLPLQSFYAGHADLGGGTNLGQFLNLRAFAFGGAAKKQDLLALKDLPLEVLMLRSPQQPPELVINDTDLVHLIDMPLRAIDLGHSNVSVFGESYLRDHLPGVRTWTSPVYSVDQRWNVITETNF